MKQFYFLLFIIIVIFNSCKKNKFDIDTNSIKIDVKINKFGHSFDSIKTLSLKQIENFRRQDSLFFDIYTEEIIKIGNISDSNFLYNLKFFFINDAVKISFKESAKEFASFDDIEQELISGLKRYKYYFPKKKTPQIYTFSAGFSFPIFVDSFFVAIPLEKYLGSENQIYNDLQIYDYMKIQMTREMIAREVFFAIAMNNFTMKEKSPTLIDYIIHRGKIIYFIKSMLPETADNLIFAYTEEQLAWCENSEDEIWDFLMSNRTILSKDYKIIKKFIEQAPFTASFGKDSPSRIGVWLGYQIVNKFMDENENYTLAKLMNENDYQMILSNSNY